MKYTISVLICLVIFMACSENKKKESSVVRLESNSGILSEKNLPKQIFTIDINTDNSLITGSGVIVQIPKGSLTSDKNPVEIEIQEALTMKDIFLAGLQTRSDGAALSSAGMIYINARSGYQVRFKEKLKVMVPTKNYNPDMQVYEGVKDSSGH